MANINSNKIEEINRWFSERKQNENPTNYEYYIETLKDLKNLNISDEYTLNQINTLLIKLSKANDFYTISEIMDELETIKEKFENDKLEIRDDSRNQRENIENENPFANLDPFADKDPVNIVQSFEGNIEIDWKEINPVELLEYILDQDGTMIDFDWLKNIDSALEDAKNMSNEELASKIKSFDLYFDIEPKDWDVYFESRNIPPEKQDEYKQNFDLFKKMYKNLTTRNVDAGNFIFEDIWGKINEEAERISNLPDGKKVIINISELKPEGQDLIFENKHDALMFLYYSKLLLNEVATIWTDILGFLQGIYWVWESLISYFMKNPNHFFFTIFVWVSVSTTWTALRKINWLIIRKQVPILRKFAKWEFLNESVYWSMDPNVSENAAEIKKRRDKITELNMLYADEPKMQKKINELEFWITVGDWKTSWWSWKWFSESTFWRKVKNIENWWIWSNKYTDTFGKLFLLNSEKISVRNNADFLKRNLLDNWEIKKGSMLDNVRTYIQLWHNISDADERELVKVLEIYENKVKSWAVWDLKLSWDDLLWELQKQILNSLNKVQGSSWEKFNFWFDIFGKREYGFENAAETSAIKSKTADDILGQIESKFGLDSYKKDQIRIFLNNVKRQPPINLYSIWTVSDVIHIIIKNPNMSFGEALEKSRKWRAQSDISNIVKNSSDDLIDNLTFLENNSSLYPTDWPSLGRLKEIRIKEALDYDARFKATIEESKLSLTEKKWLINQIKTVLDEVNNPNNTSSTADLYNTFIKNNKELFDQIEVNWQIVDDVSKLFSLDDANKILSEKWYKKAIKEIWFSLWELKNAYWTNVSYLENIPTRNQLKKQFRKHRRGALATVEYLHMDGLLSRDYYDSLVKNITKAKDINQIDALLNNRRITRIIDEDYLKSQLRNHNNNSITRIESMWITLDDDLKITSPDVINIKNVSVEEDKSVLRILRFLTKWI